MNTLLEVKHVSVSIACAPAEAYAFVSEPANLPRWAAGLGGVIRDEDGEWIADGPLGRIEVRPAAPNPLGVLDHDVVLPSGETVHNAMRVVPNGSGSELTFVLLRRPGMSPDDFARDEAAVRADLATLKRLLERLPG
jgi:hypothetical protein